MQDYLQRTRLAGVMDEAGKLISLLVFSGGWFLLWWGLSLRAVLAGLSLFGLLLLVRHKTRGRRLRRREKRLRRAIGGEIALADMLTAPPARAHFQAALLISRAYPVKLLRTGERGVLCEQSGEKLFVAFSPTPAGMAVTAREIAFVQRACKASGASRAVLLSAADGDAGAKKQALLLPKVRLLGGKEALALAGAAAPATDAQLAALARERRARTSKGEFVSRVLDRKKSLRYALYGGGLACAFYVTRQPAYAVPALLCLLLAAACLLYREKREKLL